MHIRSTVQFNPFKAFGLATHSSLQLIDQVELEHQATPRPPPVMDRWFGAPSPSNPFFFGRTEIGKFKTKTKNPQLFEKLPGRIQAGVCSYPWRQRQLQTQVALV